MSRNLYILDHRGIPVCEPDVVKWSKWFETNQRIVGRDEIGKSTVSTVFLGIDYNFGGIGYPVLWETMVFGGELDHEQDRCSGSREQAEAMHSAMIDRIKEANEQP